MMGKYFGVKKGELLIRDVVFMMLLVSSILVLASTFVTEVAGNYGNTAMSDEYALKNLSMSKNTGLFATLNDNVSSAASTLTSKDAGLWTLISSEGKTALTTILYTFITGPTQISELVKGVLVDMGVGPELATVIGIIIKIALWIIVVFGVLVAIAQGARI